MPQGLHAWNIHTFMDFLATHRFNSIRLPLSLQVGRWIMRLYKVVLGLPTSDLNPMASFSWPFPDASGC